MPKRKKMPKIPPIPDYEGIGRNPEKAYIQKSRPLRSLSETELTLPELTAEQLSQLVRASEIFSG